MACISDTRRRGPTQSCPDVSSSVEASPFGGASLGITASNPFSTPLPPFALCPALPDSTAGRDSCDYYGGSAPPQIGRPTVCPARSFDPGQTRGGSRVHLLIARRRRHPTRPLRHRRGYPAARHHGLPIRSPTVREVPRLRDEGGGCASHPAQIRQVRAGASLRGVDHRFLAYAFPPRSPHPRRLAVPTRHGFVRAAPTHPGTPGTGCPQLHRPAATGRRRSLTSYSINTRLTAHRRKDAGVDRPSRR